MKSDLNSLDNCPRCKSLLWLNIRPHSGSWIAYGFAKKHFVVKCKKCGLLFDQDVKKFRWLATLVGILFGIMMVLGLYAIGTYSVTSISVLILFAILMIFLGIVDGKIKCFSVKEGQSFPQGPTSP